MLVFVFMFVGMGLLLVVVLVVMLGWVIGFFCLLMWVLFGVGICCWLVNLLCWCLFNVMMGVCLFVMVVLLLCDV